MTRSIVSFWEWLRGSPSRRIGAVIFALIIEVLIALVFMSLGGSETKKPDKPMVVVTLPDPGAGKAKPKPDTAAAARKRGGQVAHARFNEPEIIVPPPPVEPPPNPNILWLTKPQYAGSDIGKIQPQGPRNGVNQSGAENGTGDAPGDSQLAEGKGPNGEPLYIAEWYREPTNAELSPYIPARARGRPGWGVVMCRTAERWRVEDCRELGDGPRGTGYAGAVRQAAFQFRVKPPRRGGKYLVGAWVSIRIDYRVIREERPARGDRPQNDYREERPQPSDREDRVESGTRDRTPGRLEPDSDDVPVGG